MKRLSMSTRSRLLAVALLLLAGCGEWGHDHADEVHDDHGPEPLVYTHYSGSAELFVEFPPLVAGQGSRALAHFTHLADFSPVTRGSVDVLLEQEGRTVARFRVEAPVRDGLFTPVITPREAGRFQLRFVLTSPQGSSSHDLGEVSVFASGEQVVPQRAPEQGEISYLKEQQWEGHFATEVVAQRGMRPAVPGFATVLAPADGGAAVLAPEDGHVASGRLAAAGDTVAAGDVLAFLVPRLGAGADLGTARVALQRARSEKALRQQDVERLQDLLELGAVPERRLFEARQALTVAESELAAASARLEQLHSGGDGSGFALRAPVAGEIVEARARPGAFVNAGDAVFRIATPERRWLEVRVAEHFAPMLPSASGAWLETGDDEPVLLDQSTGARIVQVATAIDPESRTASLTLEYPTTGGPALIGARHAARVFVDRTSPGLAVPRTALVDDGGREVVFVQTSGETFSRRVVETGMRDHRWVEVLSGVQAGERVVSEGAYYIRLAAAGGDDLGHGHAH